MFKLVGVEAFTFEVGGHHHSANISIEPSGFNYVYTLAVDGKPVDKLIENHRKLTKTWNFSLDGSHHIVVLGSLLTLSLFCLYSGFLNLQIRRRWKSMWMANSWSRR